MHTSTKTLKELFFFVFLIMNGYLSYKIYLFSNRDTYLLGGDTSFTFNSEVFLRMFLIFIGLTIVESLIIFFLVKRLRSLTVLASSRLLNYKQVPAEQRQQKNYMFHSKKKSRAFKNDKSGLLLSQNLKLETSKSFEHSVVIAPTGAGKSASVLRPELEELDNTSIVVIDPKKELYKQTHKKKREQGYNVYQLNLYDPTNSVGVDLLRSCQSIEEVEKLSESLLANAEGDWGKLSENLLTAVLIRSYARKETLSDVVDLLANLSIDETELLNEFEKAPAAAKLAIKEFIQTLGSEGMIASIFKTIQSELKVFKRQSMRDLQKQNKLFDVLTLRKEKAILYISYPEDESKLYSSFLSPFYYLLLNKTKNYVSEDTEKDFMSIHFLIDEFGNIGRIPEFSTFLSTIRSKKMGIQIFLQSVEQLSRNYPGEESIILENCKTKIAMAGVSSKTATTFVKLVGREQYKSHSYSVGANHSSSSFSEQTKEVLSMDDIRRIKSYQILIISDNLRPIMDDKNYAYYNKIQFFIFKHSPFNKKITDKIIKCFVF
ncbi:type IV secretory system conjugative DNA transfer family protein [Priestia aryabhattai]|uniref:type IV secretory system conjugative DNA transfer family protein n=1 Tax=Priestia aryabhattai TaxID=412384 RepID=UPI0008DC8F86|nr:type IV secretory system conjugative DNA transfer family protein [Priestia aryabhattai]OHY73287.1 hypothetical protein BCV52_27180 [Priestia aryabhattai]